MKTGLFIAILILLANSGVLAHRSLKAVYASASASSFGPGSASATSIAKGDGASAETVVVAKDGANVEAKTVAESKDGAEVKAKTTAVGDGPGADSNTTTIVKSDKDINVSRFVARVSDGEDVVTVANALVIELNKHSGPVVVKQFKTGLAEKEKKGELYFKALELFVKGKTCDAIKAIFKNEEVNFLSYKLPKVFYSCMYFQCAGYESAASCCGEAQLKQDQCNCKDGKCLWKQPKTKSPFSKYWNCEDCGESIPYCVCY
eukprot:g5842.t1